MRRRRQDDRLSLFGGDERLVRFVASEWPPVPGECLGYWWCHGASASCPSPPLVPCGEEFYRKRADDPALVESRRLTDARWRWTRARQQWLIDHGHPNEVFLAVFVEDMAALYPRPVGGVV